MAENIFFDKNQIVKNYFEVPYKKTYLIIHFSKIQITQVKFSVPRLPHFPSRLVDSRSESGVEQRRQLLDNYFRAISAWPYYPTALIKFLNVRVPEEYILERANQRLITQNGNGHMMPIKEQIYSAGLFYTGDRLFEGRAF